MKASRIPKTSSLRSGDKPPALKGGKVDFLAGRLAWRVGTEARRDGADFFTGLFTLDLGRRIAGLAMTVFLESQNDCSSDYSTVKYDIDERLQIPPLEHC